MLNLADNFCAYFAKYFACYLCVFCGKFYEVNWINKMKEKVELLMALFFMFFWVVKKQSLCAVLF